MKRFKAFTLAETMIVLVILGIVAAITIPALVRRHVESSNRTRIRKAMSVYDTAINKMVVENGIKSNDALINEFNADKNNNSCAKSRAYFKTSQDGANDCTFRASDGVWWNISDINHPIIAFNEDDLNKADEENNKAFHLVGYLDDNGSLRVSDLAKAEGDNQEYLTKLWNFINNVKVVEEEPIVDEEEETTFVHKSSFNIDDLENLTFGYTLESVVQKETTFPMRMKVEQGVNVFEYNIYEGYKARYKANSAEDKFLKQTFGAYTNTASSQEFIYSGEKKTITVNMIQKTYDVTLKKGSKTIKATVYGDLIICVDNIDGCGNTSTSTNTSSGGSNN